MDDLVQMLVSAFPKTRESDAILTPNPWGQDVYQDSCFSGLVIGDSSNGLNQHKNRSMSFWALDAVTPCTGLDLREKRIGMNGI